MQRRSIAAALAVAALAGLAPPSGAATPPLKARFRPLNNRIQSIGEDAGAVISVSSAWTWKRRADEWSLLAKRTIAVSQAVGQLRGAKGDLLVQQRKLQLALAKGATDLSSLATATRLHSARRETAARKALLRDSPPINDARSALSKALGLGK